MPMDKCFNIIILIILTINISNGQSENSIEGTWGYLTNKEECLSITDYIDCLEMYREYHINSNTFSQYIPVSDSLYPGQSILAKDNSKIELYITEIDSVVHFQYEFINEDLLVITAPDSTEFRTLVRLKEEDSSLNENILTQLKLSYYTKEKL